MSEPTPKESLRSVFEDLYDKGKALLNDYIVKCDELNVAFPIPENGIPLFDTWYTKLYDDISNKTPMPMKNRWNKVIQQGNFDISQPSGGFDVDVDKNTMISQYKKAVYGPPDALIQKPLLMVITEPFSIDFLNDPNYKFFNQKGGTCGVYYNTSFESVYEVVESPVELDEKPPLIGEKLVFFQINNKAGSDPIKIVNWHGDSKGDNRKALIDIIKFADEKGIHYITGDSNITVKKGGVPINHKDITVLIDEIQIDYTLSCSNRNISKKRIPMNIFYNNQIDKDRPEVKSDERDGMFILKLGTKKAVTGGAAVNVTNQPPLVSFFTEYDKINSPILGDHSVVETDINGLTLLVATGTNMDDNTIGLFGKPEWKNVDHATFKNRVSIPYTIRWVNLYNEWISENEDRLNDYSDKGCYFNNVSLELSRSKPDIIPIDSNDILEKSVIPPSPMQPSPMQPSPMQSSPNQLVQMQPALMQPSLTQPAVEAPVQTQSIVRPQNPIKSKVPTQPSRYFFSGGKSKKNKNKFKVKKTRKMKSTRRKRKQHRHRSKKR